MNRKIFYWKLRTAELPLGERTLIMGILNVTPDSFSDGGQYLDPDRAYARALELEQEGADIVDIGAESTRPGSARISAEQEWQRLAPVLKKLRGKLSVPLSIDTYKSEVAQRAFDYGAEIVNDPSGLTFDATLAKTAAAANAGLILNHMRGNPETWAKLPPLPDAPAAIARDLEATVNRARHAGVERNRIVVDPGIGFGKRGEQNTEILAHLSELARLDLPIMIGPSRKMFLRQETDSETLFATAAAVTAGILRGACIVRVHDVKQMRAVADVADEIARAAAVPRVQPEGPAQRLKPRPAAREQGSFAGEPVRPPVAPPAIHSPDIIPSAADREPREPVQEERRAPEQQEKGFDRNRPLRPRDSREDRFSRPRSGDDRRPRSGDDRRPQSGDERRPQSGDDRRPQSGDDRRPRSGDDRRPRSGDDRRPRSGDDRRPRSGDDRRPRSGDDRRPRSGDERRPRSGDDRRPRSGETGRPRGDRDAGPRDGSPRESGFRGRPPGKGRFGEKPPRAHEDRGDRPRQGRFQDRDKRAGGPPRRDRESFSPRSEPPRGGSGGQRGGRPPKRPFRKRP